MVSLVGARSGEFGRACSGVREVPHSACGLRSVRGEDESGRHGAALIK